MMFYGYRFESSGQYHQPDELNSVEDVFAYVVEHKQCYPRVMVTARGTGYIQVESINGQIEFPKQWALFEIQQTYLSGSDIFNAPAFAIAMERAGFPVSVPENEHEAHRILTEHYAALPDPSE